MLLKGFEFALGAIVALVALGLIIALFGYAFALFSEVWDFFGSLSVSLERRFPLASDLVPFTVYGMLWGLLVASYAKSLRYWYVIVIIFGTLGAGFGYWWHQRQKRHG